MSDPLAVRMHANVIDRGAAGRGVTLHPVGEWDYSNASELWRALVDISAAVPCGVQVDLARASFLDASCAGLLAGAAHRVRAAGSHFQVRNPTDRVRRVLAVGGLNRLLTPN